MTRGPKLSAYCWTASASEPNSKSTDSRSIVGVTPAAPKVSRTCASMLQSRGGSTWGRNLPVI
jgi:hypothetical protein